MWAPRIEVREAAEEPEPAPDLDTASSLVAQWEPGAPAGKHRCDESMVFLPRVVCQRTPALRDDQVKRAVGVEVGYASKHTLVERWTEATLDRWFEHSLKGSKARAFALRSAARELCEVDGSPWVPRQEGPLTARTEFQRMLGSVVAGQANLLLLNRAVPHRPAANRLVQPSVGKSRGIRPGVRPMACEGRSRAPSGRRGGGGSGRSGKGAGGGRGGGDSGGGGGSSGDGGSDGGESESSRSPNWTAIGAIGTWVAVLIAIVFGALTLRQSGSGDGAQPPPVPPQVPRPHAPPPEPRPRPVPRVWTESQPASSTPWRSPRTGRGRPIPGRGSSAASRWTGGETAWTRARHSRSRLPTRQ